MNTFVTPTFEALYGYVVGSSIMLILVGIVIFLAVCIYKIAKL